MGGCAWCDGEGLEIEGGMCCPPAAIFGFFDDAAATEELELYLFDQVVNIKMSTKIRHHMRKPSTIS